MSLIARVYASHIQHALSEHLSRGYTEMLLRHKTEPVLIALPTVDLVITTEKVRTGYITTYAYKVKSSGRVMNVYVEWNERLKEFAVGVCRNVEPNWSMLFNMVISSIITIETQLNVTGSPHAIETFGTCGIEGELVSSQFNRRRNNSGGAGNPTSD